MPENPAARKKSSLPSVFGRPVAESADPWIRIWISEWTSHGKSDVQKTFRAAAIEEITSFPGKDGISRLHLYNGTAIPVKMESAELWKKIFQPDFRSGGEPIDLLAVTGDRAFPPLPVPEIGDLTESKDFYIGKYRKFSKIFNVFAAPENIPGERKYDDMVQFVDSLNNWHGYNGAGYLSEKEFYAAIENGDYTGGWILPPLDILRDNLYRNRDRGDLKGHFNMNAQDKHPTYYSSTPDGRGYYMVLKFSDGTARDGFRDRAFSCRPVRLVQATP